MLEIWVNEQHLTEQGIELLRAVQGYGYIAGGYARGVLLSCIEEAGDIDVFSWAPDWTLYGTYAPDGTQTKLPQWRSGVLDNLYDIGYTHNFESDNSIRLKSPHEGDLFVHCIKPVISRFTVSCGSPEIVIGSFDFPIIKAAIWLDDGDRFDACCHPLFFDHNDRKVLEIEHINHPLNVMYRVMKYNRRGYRIAPNEMLRLFDIWRERENWYREEVRQRADQGHSTMIGSFA